MHDHVMTRVARNALECAWPQSPETNSRKLHVAILPHGTPTAPSSCPLKQGPRLKQDCSGLDYHLSTIYFHAVSERARGWAQSLRARDARERWLSDAAAAAVFSCGGHATEISPPPNE